MLAHISVGGKNLRLDICLTLAITWLQKVRKIDK